MQIVIELNEENYEVTLTKIMLACRGCKITEIVKKHGRLIDADSLIKAIEEKAKRLSNADTINGLSGAVALIFDAPTIIESDKIESEE